MLPCLDGTAAGARRRRKRP
ncbi:hypothetical protein F6X51_02475 [Methylobacterium planeticum]|uniref:Uncharacterized protein n=1 Tax=Methylobacterium planeticum TaxID=2615211 RepID=A0A6N6MXX8_9HYPH|nr:hypothetical protein F6X51_02475 [Methylobacterium planeticum]